MTTEAYLSSIDLLIEEFVEKTGDSPTHILVTADQWHAMNQPKVYEHSISCCLDYLIVGVVGDYHYPKFPMVAQLPQFLHEPLKQDILFRLGKYGVIRES